MTKQTETSPRKTQRQETVTPFLERSLTELVTLFGQLFTTPFAFVSYNRQFRDQINSLIEDDLKTAYPETVARPLTFYVLWMGAHFLLSKLYWRMLFPGSHIPSFGSNEGNRDFVSVLAPNMPEIRNTIAAYFGTEQTLIIIAFAVSLVIAVKSYLVSMAGYLLRCRVRFKTALYASAYAFGTLIFFQYAFISIRFLASMVFANGFLLGFGVIIYGTLIVCVVLMVRINQLIRQMDGTRELATYGAWFLGTAMWQFIIVLFALFIFHLGGPDQYWGVLSEYWTAFGSALNPVKWTAE